MKINKISKLKSGKYKIELDDHTSYTTYDEVILKYGLLFKKEIDNELLCLLENETQKYSSYYKVLKYCLSKMRSSYQIDQYMCQIEVPLKEQEQIKEKLKENQLLDDCAFTKAFINDQIYLTNHGPYKIKNELLKLKIDTDIIEREISNIDPNVFEEKISTLIKKRINLNKKDSAYLFKQKLNNYLLNLGYSQQMIAPHLSSIQIDNSKSLQVVYKNELKKLSKKYSDEELTFRLKNNLRAKGFSMEDIYKLMESNQFSIEKE